MPCLTGFFILIFDSFAGPGLQANQRIGIEVVPRAVSAIPVVSRRTDGQVDVAEFVVRRNAIHLVKANQPKRPSRGELIVRRLRGTGTVRMTTDEIMALTRS